MSSCAVFAQEDISSSEGEDSLAYNAFKEHVPFWRMDKNWKFSPFDVMNIVPTVGIDLETKMTPYMSFQYGAAIVPDFMQFLSGSDQFGDDRYNWMNGYRLRFESRWYGFRSPFLYVSSEISFRHLIIEDDAVFGMECDENGNCAFNVIQKTIFHRFSTWINLKVGWQKVFDNRLVFDMYAGMSFRRNNVLTGTNPPDGGVAQEWFGPLDWRLWDGHKFGYATPIVGMRLGWNIPAKADI